MKWPTPFELVMIALQLDRADPNVASLDDQFDMALEYWENAEDYIKKVKRTARKEQEH